MAINRRAFLKGVAGSGIALATGVSPAAARMSKELPPEAVGLLYDATLCIGCKSCMVNCKRENSVPGGALYKEGVAPAMTDSFLCRKSVKNDRMASPPYETAGVPGNEGIWDASRDLSGSTLSIIKVYKNGTGEKKDAAVNGHAFFKQQCLHCITPACVSVCPAGAFIKDATTGAVYYEAYRCIGCRYCQIACPFNVPRYEWSAVWPEVRKCQLCRHRLAQGKYAACAEFCPTGATIFGKVTELREEALRRFALKPGTVYDFPLQTLHGKQTVTRPSAAYADRVYGLKEAGGTQNMMLSGISFDLLGFNENLPNAALPDLTWAYIAKIPWVFLGVFLGGTALYTVTSRRERGCGEKGGDRHD